MSKTRDNGVKGEIPPMNANVRAGLFLHAVGFGVSAVLSFLQPGSISYEAYSSYGRKGSTGMAVKANGAAHEKPEAWKKITDFLYSPSAPEMQQFSWFVRRLSDTPKNKPESEGHRETRNKLLTLISGLFAPPYAFRTDSGHGYVVYMKTEFLPYLKGYGQLIDEDMTLGDATRVIRNTIPAWESLDDLQAVGRLMNFLIDVYMPDVDDPNSPVTRKLENLRANIRDVIEHNPSYIDVFIA